jgi:glycosyltransferase involved in cell wall biosynthesis
MKLLFIHQNFPGQYKHIVPHLAATGTHEIVCLGEKKNLGKRSFFDGARVIGYPTPRGAGAHTHHYIKLFEATVRRGQEVARACMSLRRSGFIPDVACVHPGWGESLFLKDVFPDTPVLDFLEFYYQSRGSDVGFDPEFPADFDDQCRVRVKNATLALSLGCMDWGVTPTHWQYEQHPREYRSRISVIHDGIDTETVRPDPDARLVLPGGRELRAGQEVVTYVSRNLEPYRGIHTFLRAVPEIQRRRPEARFVVVGGDEVSYGRRAGKDTTWREHYLAEVGERIDLDRVHFLGRVPYPVFLSVLQVSACHVYLTYPFVLSWSMLEAMAAGCLVVGSDTAPVREVIRDGENGRLVDFFSPDAVAEAVAGVLAAPDRLQPLREAARSTVMRDYDLRNVCLPRHCELIERLAAGTLNAADNGKLAP